MSTNAFFATCNFWVILLLATRWRGMGWPEWKWQPHDQQNMFKVLLLAVHLCLLWGRYWTYVTFTAYASCQQSAVKLPTNRYNYLSHCQRGMWFLGAYTYSRKARYYVRQVRPSVRMYPIGQIYVKFHIGDFFENLLRKSRFGRNRAKMSGTLHHHKSGLLGWNGVRLLG
jgi:hypothetical protein